MKLFLLLALIVIVVQCQDNAAEFKDAPRDKTVVEAIPKTPATIVKVAPKETFGQYGGFRGYGRRPMFFRRGGNYGGGFSGFGSPLNGNTNMDSQYPS
ncbi:unnamed protein product [Nippostrongylus brasiliensis]|uniref:Uncharacterized protein n=1 Tax=Nippostrongylus brasiliensis TaxID=27835 RepID=A0A0N4Y562_NIPBR|nr:unnamed protein product [Nippostrongylus brasiliensis]